MRVSTQRHDPGFTEMPPYNAITIDGVPISSFCYTADDERGEVLVTTGRIIDDCIEDTTIYGNVKIYLRDDIPFHIMQYEHNQKQMIMKDIMPRALYGKAYGWPRYIKKREM